MWKTFYSNGKLLLTGEYAILDGAVGLAIPTRFGQYLRVIQNDSQVLKWTAYDENKSIWFEEVFDLQTLQPLEDHMVVEEYSRISERLRNILTGAKQQNNQFLSDGLGFLVETTVDFNLNWGLGTSSTLINNIAQWANINPYKLLASTFGGSGYDIACAINDNPILYQIVNGLPKVTKASFDPAFKEHLFFVFLNKKQDSREAIKRYRQLTSNKTTLIKQVSELTQEIAGCRDFKIFQELILEHEFLLSKTLQLPRVQEVLFKDFRGVVKSLGAWGGDFVLAASDQEDQEYFHSRGYTTVIPYGEMLL